MASMRMTLIERFYPESRFGGFSDIDGTVAFYSRVNSMLGSDDIVLDVGAGRGAALIDDRVEFRRNLRKLRGKCKKVIGIDVDANARSNPGLDEFHMINDVSAWPVADSSVDILTADFVLEHVNDPALFFKEVVRVLKPGGVFCARTTNRLGYVGLIASMVPNNRHAKVARFAQKDRAEIDVFPTRYQVNTVWVAKQYLKSAGLEGVVYGYEAEPSYLQFSALAYAVGKFLHALTPGILRSTLFIFCRKPT